MELMDKFLNQSTIELMDKFLDKLTIGPQAKEEDLGPCNLKRGGTNHNLISRAGNPTPPRSDLDNPEKFNVEGEHHNKEGQ